MDFVKEQETDVRANRCIRYQLQETDHRLPCPTDETGAAKTGLRGYGSGEFPAYRQ